MVRVFSRVYFKDGRKSLCNFGSAFHSMCTHCFFFLRTLYEAIKVDCCAKLDLTIFATVDSDSQFATNHPQLSSHSSQKFDL